MSTERGSGVSVLARWGTVNKCPHCDRTNIQRKHPKQETCGFPKCQAARDRARRLRKIEIAVERATQQRHELAIELAIEQQRLAAAALLASDCPADGGERRMRELWLGDWAAEEVLLRGEV